MVVGGKGRGPQTDFNGRASKRSNVTVTWIWSVRPDLTAARAREVKVFTYSIVI